MHRPPARSIRSACARGHRDLRCSWTAAFLLVSLALALLAPSAGAGDACCGITAIEARTGMVTAKETTKGMAAGRTFQFKVADRKALTGLKVGQPIHADFKTMKVSLNPDGGDPCCQIVNLRALRP